MVRDRDDVIVIGGRIVGASAAYRLARVGNARVTLVDRTDAGQAAAAGAGILSPNTSYKPPDAIFPAGVPRRRLLRLPAGRWPLPAHPTRRQAR